MLSSMNEPLAGAAQEGPSSALRSPGCVADRHERPVSAGGRVVPQNIATGAAEQPVVPAVVSAENAVGQDEAKRSTVEATVPVFKRQFPDIAENDCREALDQCYRADNTIQMLIEAAFEHLLVKLTGAPEEEQQAPAQQRNVAGIAIPAADPNDEEEAFRQETLHMRQAMHISEVENAINRRPQGKPMHDWCAKEFQEHFPRSTIVTEVCKSLKGPGIDNMCTRETSSELQKLLKNEKYSQQWYRTETGLYGYWAKYAEELMCVGAGILRCSSPEQASEQQGGAPLTPSSQGRKRKAQVGDIPASQSEAPDAALSPDYKKHKGSHSPLQEAAQRPCSQNMPPSHWAPSRGATPDEQQGAVGTSESGRSTSPAETGRSTPRRSRRIKARAESSGPSRAGSAEPTGAKGRTLAPCAAEGHSQHKEDSGIASQSDAGMHSAPDAHPKPMCVQEQYCSVQELAKVLSGGRGPAGIAGHKHAGKEGNGSVADASASVGECERERGGEKGNDEEGGCTGMRETQKSGLHPPPTAGKVAQDAPSKNDIGQQTHNGRLNGLAAGSDSQPHSGGNKNPGNSEFEQQAILELNQVLKSLNEKFEKEVLAVASTPERLAAFVPFRPVQSSGDGEEGVTVCGGVKCTKSAEGAIEID